MQIKNFAKFEYLTAFELIKHEGDHSRLKFSASISEDLEEACLSCEGRIISVTFQNMPIFYGRVESVEVEHNYSRARVHVSCVSLSIITDEISKSRIFHNPEKKLSDVLDKSRLKLESCSLNLSSRLSSKKYELVIFQNDETNFEFISRLAKTHGSRLWILDTMSEPELCLDECINETPRKISKNQIHSIRIVKEKKRSKIFLRSSSYFEFGRSVEIKMESKDLNDYVITGFRAWLENQTYLFDYELEEKQMKFELPPIAVSPVKFPAKVKLTKDPKNLGRIQVEFDEKFVEDMDKKNPLWIPYRSPYSGKSGGIVFLPDENDPVEIFFVNEELYAVSTYRENPLADECRNVEDKYIGNNFKQRMFWKEKSLEFFSDKYKIVMNERGIELIVADNSIFINENGIYLKTKDSQISITDSILMNAKSKTEVKSNDVLIESKSKTEIKSNDVLIESKSKTEIKSSDVLIESKSKTEIKSSDVLIESKSKTEVKSSSAEIKGISGVEINAGGSLNLKGGTIKLS